MFAQVGVDAPRELAGGALLCEISTLVRSPPFFRRGGETSSAGGPGAGAGGCLGPDSGKGIRAGRDQLWGWGRLWGRGGGGEVGSAWSPESSG